MEPDKNCAESKRFEEGQTHQLPTVVAIGSSAGGLQALEEFFSSIPADIPACFVVIQHLSPDYRSHLDQLLQRRTMLQVCPIANEMVVQAGKVCVLPPNQEAIICQGRLLLTPRSSDRNIIYPVDDFLRSLANEAGCNAIAVILSGTGSDGSRGVRDISLAGGFVIAQTPESACFAGMPRNAIATGQVDQVLSPSEAAKAVADRLERPYASGQSSSNLVATSETEQELDAAMRILRSSLGFECSDFPTQTIREAITHRVDDLGLESTQAYYELLTHSLAERQRLQGDINHGMPGEFFRDEAVYAQFGHEFLRGLMNPGRDGQDFRSWVIGCGTGEEVYSLAIVLAEWHERDGIEPRVKIFASDTHTHSLSIASKAVYTRQSLTRLSPQRIKKYFIERTDGYHVVPELRKMVVFTPHDSLREAPFTRMDLICCRHWMSRLSPIAQAKALSLIHFALRDGGALVLSPEFQFNNMAQAFEPVAAELGIFLKHRMLGNRRAQPVQREGRRHGLLSKVVHEPTTITPQDTTPNCEPVTGRSIDQVPRAEPSVDLQRASPRPVETVSLDPKPDVETLIDRCNALERELALTRGDLQLTIQNLRLANEDLTSINEELTCANDELQSTNEQLCSLNEELHTVNAEHQRKIDELTELNDDLDNLLTNSNVHTLFLSRDLRVRLFTPSIVEVFHLMPQDIGRHISTFNHNLLKVSLAAEARRVLQEDQVLRREVQSGNGSWFVLRIFPYLSRGSIDGVVITLVDITSQKIVQDALQRSEQRFQLAVQRRDRFLAMLSHELRNPLAAVLCALQLHEEDSSQRERAVQVIGRQSKQMARLLDDLLDVSRLNNNKFALVIQPLDLSEVIDSAMAALQPMAARRGLCIKFHRPVPVPTVKGDPQRLEQVITNLLNNAIKYSPSGGTIEVSLEQRESVLTISVEDSGLGLSPEMKEKVFELFVQSSATLDRADGGMGVGLTLVKAIVEMHGGRVSVHSEGLNKGCKFIVELPFEPAQIQPSKTPDDAIIPSIKVVIVEDMDDSREMLAELLSLKGYEVAVASEGIEGCKLISRSVPDVAIIDIGLPNMNGFEIAKCIREDAACNRVRLVALTGYGQPADRQAVQAAGFDAHLVKPLKPGDLLNLMRPRLAKSA